MPTKKKSKTRKIHAGRTSSKTGPFCGAMARHKKRAGLSDYSCKLPAGYQTDHPGQGRCKFHGGKTPIKHGRYTTVTTHSIRELFEQVGVCDPDPLDLLPDLNLARAVLIDFINRYQEYSDALIHWHTSYKPGKVSKAEKPMQILDIADASRMIERVSRIVAVIMKVREEGSIRLETFKRLQEQMALSVAKHVEDVVKLRRIQKEWDEIRVVADTESPVDHAKLRDSIPG